MTQTKLRGVIAARRLRHGCLAAMVLGCVLALPPVAHAGKPGAVAIFSDQGDDIAQGRSALHYASRDGSLGLLERLLTGGLPPGGVDSSGLTPLHFAAGPGGAVAGVRRLVEAGAPVDAPSACGLTPLHAAAIEGKDGIAAALLDRGANVNARTRPTAGGSR